MRARAGSPRPTPDRNHEPFDAAAPAPFARIDVWMWRARVVRTRALAAALGGSGHVRLNGRRVDGPGRRVKVGDVLTIALERDVRVLEILALGERRGPATEAGSLFRDLSSPAPP